jgi:hypothetical protein
MQPRPYRRLRPVSTPGVRPVADYAFGDSSDLERTGPPVARIALALTAGSTRRDEQHHADLVL